MNEIEQLSEELYAHNVVAGWWDDPDRCIFQCLQLVSTEIAEATEAERKNLMDDKLPHRKGGEVELADALIRTLDLGGRFGLTYLHNVGHIAMCDATGSIGKRHMGINVAICHLVVDYAQVYGDGHLSKRKARAHLSYSYTRLVNAICYVANSQKYDIMGALAEKHEFNKTRPDHTRGARAQPHGKTF